MTLNEKLVKAWEAYMNNKTTPAWEAYLDATRELYRTGAIFDKLCEKEFGKDAGTYRYIREYYTPEIRAAADAYNVAAKAFHEAAEAYRNAQK